jgi:hypothetical protein
MYFRPHMPISRDRLEIARSLIKKDGEKEGFWYTSSKFDNFLFDVVESLHTNKIKDDARKAKLSRTAYYLEGIHHDMSVLLNICHQANWQKTMTIQRNLDYFHNMKYGAVLADAFLTRYRSTYDTIAKAFCAISKYPNQAPESFTDLRNKDKNDNNVRLFGKELARLIQDCDWYDQMVEVRDDVVHRNAITSGFMASKILFQVTKRFKNKIDFPEVMFNENLVDFELYAAVHISNTLWFLEEFARIGYDILQPIGYSSERHRNHDGFGVLKEWIERVLAAPTQAK